MTIVETGALNILVGSPCVATAYNNTHLNYLSKKNSRFLLIVSALCIIYFLIWLTDVIVYFMEICLCTTQPIK
jgi:MFS superfamily sulfate permease-like transporter